MKPTFRSSFSRDLRKLPDDAVRKLVREAILAVEAAASPSAIPNIKKLSGRGGYFRIRIGEYRIGIMIAEGTATFVRVLHRRDIYRYFP